VKTMKKNLSPRENLLSLYRRQGYEYAPLRFDLCESQHQRFIAETGQTDYFAYFNFPSRSIPKLSVERKPEKFHKYYQTIKSDTFFDDWGVGSERGSEAAYHMTRMRHPLQNIETIDELVNYPWPDYVPDPTADYKEMVKNIHEQGLAAYGGLEVTIWERSWYIRSMDGLMADMMDEDEKAIYLLDKVTETACKNAAHFANAGVDFLHLGDDIGTQRSILMGVEMYRKWIMPRLKKVIDTAKTIKPDILIQYHSCGQIMPLIDSLIEAGIDILNPVQPECMDFAEIHAKYGDVLSFNGTLGTQTTMPFGTPNQVREIVETNLAIAGQKGGLFVCPTHVVEPEVPWENVLAYVDAINSWRI